MSKDTNKCKNLLELLMNYNNNNNNNNSLLIIIIIMGVSMVMVIEVVPLITRDYYHI